MLALEKSRVFMASTPSLFDAGANASPQFVAFWLQLLDVVQSASRNFVSQASHPRKDRHNLECNLVSASSVVVTKLRGRDEDVELQVIEIKRLSHDRQLRLKGRRQRADSANVAPVESG